MIGRCSRPTHKRYSDYGGRGISVSLDWQEDFWNFINDVGERPQGRSGKRPTYSLDRVDNNGNYEKGNVRWATYSEQRANRRPAKPRYKRPPREVIRPRKLDYNKAEEIRTLVRDGAKRIDVAKLYDINESTVQKIVNYTRWKKPSGTRW